MAKIFIYHYLYIFKIVYFLLFYFILEKYYAPFYPYGYTAYRRHCHKNIII